jgi:hypothetical protein
MLSYFAILNGSLTKWKSKYFKSNIGKTKQFGFDSNARIEMMFDIDFIIWLYTNKTKCKPTFSYAMKNHFEVFITYLMFKNFTMLANASFLINYLSYLVKTMCLMSYKCILCFASKRWPHANCFSNFVKRTPKL